MIPAILHTMEKYIKLSWNILFKLENNLSMRPIHMVSAIILIILSSLSGKGCFRTFGCCRGHADWFFCFLYLYFLALKTAAHLAVSGFFFQLKCPIWDVMVSSVLYGVYSSVHYPFHTQLPPLFLFWLIITTCRVSYHIKHCNKFAWFTKRRT